MDLNKVSKEIRTVLEKKRKKIKLTFIEDEHMYFMKDVDGKIKNNFPSVSKVIKKFYVPFDSQSKALEMSDGNQANADILLEKWKKSGDYSTNLGSRVHYMLEQDIISRYGNYKEVRKPIFECDDTQLNKSDGMISAGRNYVDIMLERGAVLLDTEMVLGDPELGYTGQPDKIWLIMNKTKDNFGLVITDWKTNQQKNFEIQPYTKKMLHPFENYHDTALTHYYIQLPLYGKLLSKMLEGSKYENLKLLGCIIVHLKDDSTYTEYRVPSEITNSIMTMDIKKYI